MVNSKFCLKPLFLHLCTLFFESII
jgi:hypothetical protein